MEIPKYLSPEEYGEKNELRAFELAEDLIKQLKEQNPGVIIFSRCMLSTKKSTKDRRGEDIRIRLETVFPDQHRENGYALYDIKSSVYHAQLRDQDQAKFESFMNTRLTAQTKNARFHKRLVVNERRGDREIQEQMLQDLKDARLLPDNINF